MRRPRRNQHDGITPWSVATNEGALAIALKRNDWERAALLLLIAMATAIRNAPPGTIDDVLSLLSESSAEGA